MKLKVVEMPITPSQYNPNVKTKTYLVDEDQDLSVAIITSPGEEISHRIAACFNACEGLPMDVLIGARKGIDGLRVRIAEMEAMLRKLEWYQGSIMCPICDGERIHDHDCQLKAILDA